MPRNFAFVIEIHTFYFNGSISDLVCNSSTSRIGEGSQSFRSLQSRDRAATILLHPIHRTWSRMSKVGSVMPPCFLLQQKLLMSHANQRQLAREVGTDNVDIGRG